MFDVINTTLSAEVVDNGTFTVSYPTGRSAGSYTGTHDHKMFVNQTLFQAPTDFTLSFGASSITTTWKADTTLAANTELSLQVDRVGVDTGEPEKVALPDTLTKAPLYRVDLGSPIVNDADGICASQSVTLNVEAVVDGARGATMDVPRNIVAAWTTNAILTVEGYDADNNFVVEKSSSSTSFTGKKAFKRVTSLIFSASVTGATIGFGNVLGLPRYVSAAENIVEEYADGVAFGRPSGKVYLSWEIEQTELLAATAEQIVCPVAGWINKARGIVQSAVTTGGPVTFEVNTVAVVGLAFTIANADAAGVRYSDTPTTRHSATTVVAAGDEITVSPGAAIDTAGQLNGVIEVDVSAAGRLDGTFVAGVTSAATATTGDTRGTYAPSITPDGAVAFALLVKLEDPTDAGVPQYEG